MSKTVVINIKTDLAVKTEVQRLAEEFGLSLSGVINALLKNLIRTKELHLELESEEPTESLLKALAESDKDIKEGRVSPVFKNGNDAVAWLRSSSREYENKAR